MSKVKGFFTRIHEIEEKYSTDTVKYKVEIGDYHTCEAGWWFVEKYKWQDC